jgi:hypothetical protein
MLTEKMTPEELEAIRQNQTKFIQHRAEELNSQIQQAGRYGVNTVVMVTNGNGSQPRIEVSFK